MQESPVPDTISTQRSITMSFPEALAALILGAKITRVDWDSNEEYGFMLNEFLSIHTKGKDHTWLVSEADMKATDWKVVR